jgi:hypothetical protein
MKHLKLFEHFYNKINLIVKFKKEIEYQMAIGLFFQKKSKFFAEEYDDEFRSISFPCSDQDEADWLEKAIQEKLDKKGFSNFYFESEDVYNERVNYDEEDGDEYFGYVLDDLKSNFRSWEYDHDNAEDANGLFNILVERHPDEDEDELKDLAFSWVGYEESEE